MKINAPGAHLDHMLKQTRMHHYSLSMMADTKANMLLTISSVILTISVPRLIDPDFRIAAVVLILFCLLTISLAVYSVMPKIGAVQKLQKIPGVNDPGFNWLFFGDFVRISYEHYEGIMEQILNDHSMTYETQVRELYTLGKFLAGKKYRYLRMAYLSFIIGLFTSGITLLFTTII